MIKFCAGVIRARFLRIVLLHLIFATVYLLVCPTTSKITTIALVTFVVVILQQVVWFFGGLIFSVVFIGTGFGRKTGFVSDRKLKRSKFPDGLTFEMCAGRQVEYVVVPFVGKLVIEVVE